MFERGSGILLGISSLPGKYGIGTVGKEAHDFVDFLTKSKQKLWQIFPLGPTGYGNSPYQCFSSFAGNPYLINLEKLVEEGYVKQEEIEVLKLDENWIDYGKLYEIKLPLLEKLHSRFLEKEDELEKARYELFCKEKQEWLDDYALFMGLKKHFNGLSWFNWEDNIRKRDIDAIAKYTELLQDEINSVKFIQYTFFKQWKQLKAHAAFNGIKIVGDIPIFIAEDSSDAWSHPELFLFDEDRKPVKVAGVPPDYFSKTGQLWGNPLYDWDYHKETGYEWWIKRVEENLELVDIIRIDHFRGFAGYWSIDAGETTAMNGRWEKGPGRDLFEAIEKALGKLPFIAEDLGVITPDVEELRDGLGLPGMKILQFGFDKAEGSDFLPHTFDRNCVVYTGTHDNNTSLGWFQAAPAEEKEDALRYMKTDGEEISWDFIRLGWSSSATLALAPMQDLLSLGSDYRINEPGTLGGRNWEWMVQDNDLTNELLDKLKDLTLLYRRW